MGRSFLIQQLKNGNEKAFEQIVKSYWPRLYAFTNIYVINKEAAKEIVQDTFLVLWDQRKILDDNTCLITYLMVVSRNKCLNYLKSLQLNTIPIDDLNEDDSLEILITKELNQAIAISLEKLPMRTREIFMLSRYSGLRNKEIADQLEISTKNVEYHINNALKQLKCDLMQDYFTVAICILQFIWMKK